MHGEELLRWRERCRIAAQEVLATVELTAVAGAGGAVGLTIDKRKHQVRCRGSAVSAQSGADVNQR